MNKVCDEYIVQVFLKEKSFISCGGPETAKEGDRLEGPSSMASISDQLV